MKISKEQPTTGTFVALWLGLNGNIFSDNYEWKDGKLMMFDQGAISGKSWVHAGESVNCSLPLVYVTGLDESDYSKEELKRVEIVLSQQDDGIPF